MSFNPVTWNNTEPTPTQLISNGQETILNNFNFLSDASGLPAAMGIPWVTGGGYGYMQFPNGLILQWINIKSLASGTVNIVFTSVGLQNFPTYTFAAWAQGISHNSGQASIQISDTATFDNTRIGLKTDVALPNGCFLFLLGM